MEDDLNFLKMEDDLNFWEMEDDLNCFENVRQPPNQKQLKVETIIFLKLEDDLNYLKRKTTSISLENEDDLKKIIQPKTLKSKNNNIFENGRRPHFF